LGLLKKTLKRLGLLKEKKVLVENQKNPLEFSLRNQDGKTVRLSDYNGKYVLLYFYPKDNTPGCTKQACGLRDEFENFKQQGAVVLGVSRDDEGLHRQFKSKHRLPFDLLIDEGAQLAKTLGISTMPILGWHKRQSVLIGKDGRILLKYLNVDADQHAANVLRDLRGINDPSLTIATTEV
jgi:thioredoxin-dependent peroxiredoxin